MSLKRATCGLCGEKVVHHNKCMFRACAADFGKRWLTLRGKG